ncbi:MAG: phenylalanine--tRNA ligase subunit alpha [Candidatus Makana argininalis]
MKNILNILDNLKKKIQRTNNKEKLNLIKIKYLGRKGFFNKKIKNLLNLPIKLRNKEGLIINKAKKDLINFLAKRTHFIEITNINKKLNNKKIDISLPGRKINMGNIHPISKTISIIENFFLKIGFKLEFGPEIEDCYHNFDYLNITQNHPARSNKDTFWLDKIRLLRTQTSSVQIRIMKANKPPISIISSGKVYRNDYDKKHTPMFHQTEGLLIDINVSFANLKNLLNEFLYYFFNQKIKIRFRPSYFPFTEPSAEVDIFDKNGNWLEVLGCGMIHPKILDKVNINSKIYSGFAFGIGIERLTSLRYGILDLREFFENDVRFLKQFK